MAARVGFAGPAVILMLGLFSIGVTSCSELNCTDLGCDDGLSVELAGQVPEAYVVLFSLPDGSTVMVSCEDVDCRGHVSLNDTPGEVLVTVLVDDVAVATERFFPTYVTVTPNGADCPPSCLRANLTINLN